MTRRKVLRLGCLIVLIAVVLVVAIEVVTFGVAFYRARARARVLGQEAKRASEACYLMGEAGTRIITVHAPWGVFNRISFNFRKRRLDDRRLDLLAGLTGVVGLDLSDNPITDEGMRHVGQVPHLQWLQLSGTQITDEGLKHLAHLKHLHTLDITRTAITQEGAKYLAEMPMLEVVYARGTGLNEVEGVTVNTTELPDTWLDQFLERPLRQE